MTLELNRRDMFRYTAVGLGSLVLLGSVAACAPEAAAPGAVGSSADPTNFNFASWGMSEDATKPVLQAALDKFANSKGVSAEASAYPFNDYLNQLTLQTRGNQFSGAAQLDVAWLASLAALGKLTDLGGLTEGRGYTAAALKAGTFDGKQLGLPWTIAAIGLVTNTELLERAGATSDPKTIEEFEENLRAIKGLGVIPYAAATKAAGLKDILVWMQTFGSPIMEDGKSTIGDDASIEAVTWYKKLFDEGLIAADVDRSAARSLFAQGQTAIYDDAPAGKAGVVGQSPDAAFADKMVPISRPVMKDGDAPQELLWGHLIVVVEGEGSDTAAEFAQWLTSDEAQTVDYFEKLGNPPTTEAALASDEVAANTFVSSFTEKVTTNASSSPLWPYVQYAQMEAAIAEQVQAVLIGQSSAADAMKQAGETVNGLIG